ncbi:MFS transporter [Pseudaeromonas sp. ZJS20]|uniref:MFS transporter n=1 Tax=Pseudaeromonas aegiceratis TaxID=3153928 RepID=UPI00390CD1E2
MIPSSSTARQDAWLLWPLAAIHFYHLLDLLMLQPLAPQLMSQLALSSGQFASLVTAYALCAAVGGLIAALFIDRVERKRLLLCLFALFSLMTLLCGLASDYGVLLLARGVSGLAGGMLSAMVQTLIGDLIPPERRGRATGLMMSMFSLASILGVPLALWLSELGGWRLPFVLLATLALPCALVAAWRLPRRPPMPQAKLSHPLAMWGRILAPRRHRAALLFVCCGVFSGACVMPFLAIYLTQALQVSSGLLSWVYLLGGAATLLASRWVGGWSDRVGKPQAFLRLAGLSLLPITLITQLPPLPWYGLLLATTLFFLLVPCRSVPAVALVTSSVDPALRGGFLAMNASCQQLATAAGATVAGQLVQVSEQGVSGYGYAGLLGGLATLAAMVLCLRIPPLPRAEPSTA